MKNAAVSGVAFGPPDLLAEADEVHVSCTFTYDKPKAERLAEQWRVVAPMKTGGVAYCDPRAEFVPGRYIKLGYGFTSRGCPRRCWFCSVNKFWLGPFMSLCKRCHDSTKRLVETRGFRPDVGPDGRPLDPCHPIYSRR